MDANQKLDTILTTMAEQRGAGRAMKAIYALIIAVLSLVGGFAGKHL